MPNNPHTYTNMKDTVISSMAIYNRTTSLSDEKKRLVANITPANAPPNSAAKLYLFYVSIR
jgi:hypothetical protein